MPTASERKQANYALAAEICNHLPGWEPYERPGYEEHDTAFLRHTKTGRLLYFREPLNGKLTIEPAWVQRDSAKHYGQRWYFPHEYRDCPKQNPITVTLSRGPQALAREIERRLVPGVFAACDWLEDRMRRDTEFEDSAARTLDRMAEACSVKTPLDQNNYRKGALSPCFPGDVYGQVKVNSADSVALEIRFLSADLAEKVLKLIMSA